MAKWVDDGTFENRARLLYSRKLLKDHKWDDLDKYAEHLEADHVSHDERLVIHGNILREVKARWGNQPTTLMPKYYKLTSIGYNPTEAAKASACHGNHLIRGSCNPIESDWKPKHSISQLISSIFAKSFHYYNPNCQRPLVWIGSEFHAGHISSNGNIIKIQLWSANAPCPLLTFSQLLTGVTEDRLRLAHPPQVLRSRPSLLPPSRKARDVRRRPITRCLSLPALTEIHKRAQDLVRNQNKQIS
ncbi:hypothetical protein LX32DRAFT_94227 [Colletotrichum zoysiae]|uniref:Uncharacterized protein n=1 Tax=Colletotrichum zoysiae TaxID=1216348 RepID=A0AAD9H903_9PEZI|nr:hypothetical protein LX32DRAFT_94227 [Colletotrichum zoysiae]